jgi:UDP-glucose 4-epimerase
MYRIPYRVPLTDEDVRQAVNPNDRTKLVVERMLRDVEVAHGIRHLALRYFNSIGPELGNLHEPETHLIPRVLLRPGDGGLLKDLSQHGESLEIAFRQQEIMA